VFKESAFRNTSFEVCSVYILILLFHYLSEDADVHTRYSIPLYLECPGRLNGTFSSVLLVILISNVGVGVNEVCLHINTY
jgi:hypothetical protein